MKTNILIIFIIFFSIQNISAQLKVERLIGTWKSFETESEHKKNNKNNPINEQNESNYKREVMVAFLKFNQNNQMEYSIDGLGDKTRYKLKDSILTMGIRKYTIMKLTEKILIIRSDIFSTNEIYKRIEK